MGHLSQPVFFSVCRSCRRHGWTASKPMSRAFSTTPSKGKVIPSFTPTSSPELDALFQAWRDKVFTPSALQEHHRKLIYKPSRHETLTNDPGVTVTMSDDEEIKLQPMNAFDKPNKRQSLKQIMQALSATHHDATWDNVAPFLRGMVMSKSAIPSTFYEKLTRKASEVGKERLIINCAEDADATGFSLVRKGVMKELMLGLHTRAAVAHFEPPESDVAARRAEKVKRMLEDRLHGREKLAPNQEDPRSSPLVLGVLLELAAARASHSPEERTLQDDVQKYARRLLHLSQAEASTSQSTSDTALYDLCNQLEMLLPIQNGITMALRLQSIQDSELKPQLEQHLQKVTDRVDEAVQTIRQALPGKARRALMMYDQLHGTTYNGSREEAAAAAAAVPEEDGQQSEGQDGDDRSGKDR